MTRPMKRRTTRGTANKVKGISVSDPEYLTQSIEPFDGVWSGQIARLRFYASQQWVQAFLAPGNNNNLIGTTTNPLFDQGAVFSTGQWTGDPRLHGKQCNRVHRLLSLKIRMSCPSPTR
jgi:hypothetical protein